MGYKNYNSLETLQQSDMKQEVLGFQSCNYAISYIDINFHQIIHLFSLKVKENKTSVCFVVFLQHFVQFKGFICRGFFLLSFVGFVCFFFSQIKCLQLTMYHLNQVNGQAKIMFSSSSRITHSIRNFQPMLYPKDSFIVSVLRLWAIFSQLCLFSSRDNMILSTPLLGQLSQE